ncbi:hypothetical protein LOK49_LG08G00959 [Camellia lanceoleosa]|uniref:Uncharacterized protein n=1 Tax=Camellia lanceoleosa TaxID=1840588 RepID=A0ACC0GW06_9ERIC|nr:hypothetical protein LOK49_LG08G00959 [Camellia lanceoleosa]
MKELGKGSKEVGGQHKGRDATRVWGEEGEGGDGFSGVNEVDVSGVGRWLRVVVGFKDKLFGISFFLLSNCPRSLYFE